MLEQEKFKNFLEESTKYNESGHLNSERKREVRTNWNERRFQAALELYTHLSNYSKQDDHYAVETAIDKATLFCEAILKREDEEYKISDEE